MSKNKPSGTPETADLDWDSGAAVRSTRFDDVYFSDLGGLEETTHVFLNGNNIAARFADLASGPAHQVFTIGELGFGTGLNILAAWQAWQQRGHEKGHLHLLTVEGFPLSAEDFAKAQQQISDTWPTLAPLAKRLNALYPPLVTGIHSLPLADDVTLTLMIGEVGNCLAQATAQVDAWFLDGFSPSRNPEMWRDEVMDEIARLSAKDTSLATFTVAGTVRRGLEARGFGIEKAPGFGRKRDMLKARVVAPTAPAPSASPWYNTPYTSLRGRRVAVIGAGIAGASAAWHLQRAGLNVTLYDKQAPAAGASGNMAGLVLPRLDLDDSPAAGFYKASWLYAVQFIRLLEEETGTKILQARGGLKIATDEQTAKRHTALVEQQTLPPSLMQLAENTDNLDITTGGTISPPASVKSLIGNIPFRQDELLGIEQTETNLLLNFAGQGRVETDYVVIANGVDALKVTPALPLTASLGQIDIIDQPPPDKAMTAGHYIAPYGNKTCIGATYDNVSPETVPEWSKERAIRNIEMARGLLPEGPEHSLEGRASLRCVTPDRHPICGPLPDWDYYEDAYLGLRTGKKGPYPPAHYQPGIYLLTGLGSRGLSTAPLCAAHLASQLTGAPSPLPQGQQELLHPARFRIRQLKKNQPVP